MKIIEKIVVSKICPKNTNVLWYNPTNNSLNIFGIKGWHLITGCSCTGNNPENNPENNPVIVYPPNNEIWYTTNDNLLLQFLGYCVNPNGLFGANIVNHIYNGDKGIITLDGDAIYVCDLGGDNGLTSITLPNSVIRIEGGAFKNCSSLTSVTMGNNVETIGVLAFLNCTDLTSITLSNNIKYIKYGCFNNCTSLTSITIPKKVIEIESLAFFACLNLKEVICLALTPPQISYDIFLETQIELPGGVIYVPAESVETYKNATNWTYYIDKIQAIPS